MGINLQKGQRIDLTKNNPGLKKVEIGLGWDTNKYHGGAEFDLDVSVFPINEHGKVQNDLDFVFYNNLVSQDGSIEHTGDNRTGEGEGDDEVIRVDFSKISSYIKRIGITVTIYESEQRRQNFGMVSNSYARIVDAETGSEIARFDLGEDFSTETAVVVGELYLHNGEWKFEAIGSGFPGGLADLCRNYGLSV